MQSSNAADKSKMMASSSLWQHPYVDVFKHFKIIPNADWKQNKKQGDVQEIFAKEIGRKALSLQGSISANNFIQIPHPNSLQKSLGLTGRYIYLELKSASAGNPFSIHFDFAFAERSHNVRLSLSNLFKSFHTSNGFVVQTPLEVQSQKWTVVVVDLFEIFKMSQIFPPTYRIEGAHSLKSATLCANIQTRGVYTSDNLYDFVTLPSDMRFKFSFDINKWEEYFSWVSLPQDLEEHKNSSSGVNVTQTKKIGAKEQTLTGNKTNPKAEERKRMQHEIDTLLQRDKKIMHETEEEEFQSLKKSRIGLLPEIGLLSPPEEQPVTGYLGNEKHRNTKNKQFIANLQANKSEYVSGSYIGVDLKRSPKLNLDPILELKHIIGYSPDKCLNLKWSKFQNENVVIFTSGGTLIAMDVDTNTQKRFFFGHSAPICCFDINANGALLASAQEGKNSIIRIWEYASGRCISMVTMPVNTLKCLSFSYDGRYLASSGKDTHNREILIVWDITRIAKGEKPEIVAKQTSDFNILCLKFSPIDSSRLASCGKENIRFWRIKENGVIRGSAVVLNHHARNTVFTSLDFEFGFRSNDPKENEALKRLFVGSKHGMVFQINYHTENLEATYQTNDSAIYSIAVNEAFCVTGSEDTYLRVWPLDFSEFFMEAKHEGTVCAVDISPDGLKVVCGTLYGSLGILDKSNQKYRTLLRSHTDQILNMDFHLLKRNIITVSRDKTIRLWDIDNSDQVYEFSSPIDQPLTVAAHPYLPLFSCGFESGALRVFDIEKTCVAVEFSQFNKPLLKVAYSPFGDLLVTCCVDGGVAIHSPKRQHQAIKMMHLEFPPEFVHVAFSIATSGGSSNATNNSIAYYQNENSDPNEQLQRRDSKFAIMGEYGNNVNIYDSTSFFVQHQIQANHVLRQFVFANNNRDIVLITTDCKIKVYSLAKYEGILLREITTVHRGNVMSTNISSNCGYMLTGGEDSMIKVWDYEASKTVPFFFQSFIGHTSPVVSIMFNPTDNGVVLSAGERDGIYLWEFHGDTKTQFAHQPIQQEESSLKAISQQQQKTLSQQPSILEKMRTTRKENKLQQNVGENSFILPSFKALQEIDPSTFEQHEDYEEQKQQQILLKNREERGLSYNHYADCGQQFDIELEQQMHQQIEGEGAEKYIEAHIVNGYDGFGGVHDNLVWHSQAGWAAYTLNNKLIFENTKTREQTVIIESTTQLSTLVLSPNKALLAVAEGRTNKRGNSVIYLYDTHTRKQTQKLTFHQRGVQSIAFSNDSKYLISVAVQGENTLAVWDLSQGLVVKSAMIKHNAINQVKVDPFIEDSHIQFCTVGSQGAFTFWRLDLDQLQFQNFDVVVPQELQQLDFISLSFTPYYGAPYNTYLILLGLNNGQLAGFDNKNQAFVENLQRYILSDEIGCITCKNQFVVAANSTGTITKYPTTHSIFPQGDYQILEADGPVVALSMDELNNEGMVGTSTGSIYYINFDEKIIIKLISSSSSGQDGVAIAKFNDQNTNLFLTTAGSNSCTVKLWATNTVDQVMKFTNPPQSPVRFILSNPQNSKLALIGHENGILKVISVDTLNTESLFAIELAEKEQLVSATFNSNGVNFAIGTSHGNVYFGSQRYDNDDKLKLLVGKLDNISPKQGEGAFSIKSVQFSVFDPIGSFLVAYEDGLIKIWQSSVKNEQFMRLLEFQQQSKENQQLDLAECGYQQFDLLDKFDMFENPHGQEDLSEDEKSQLKLLYSGKKHTVCEAKFAPGASSADIYFSFVSSLQYIFVRNYVQRCIVKRVSLMNFPNCLSLVDYSQLQISSQSHHDDQPTGRTEGGESVLACVGTKEGTVQLYKVDSQGYHKVSQSRSGLSYGAVMAIDVSPQAEKLIATSQSGEILTFNLLEHLEQQ